MGEFNNEGFEQTNHPWGDGDEDVYGAGRVDGHFDSQIVPPEDVGMQPAWMDFDCVPDSFTKGAESRDIPYGFGIRQFDGIEPTPEEIADNIRDFYNTESVVLHTHASFTDRRVYAGDSGENYDDTLPVMSYQHLALTENTDDGTVKITVDGSRGIMVDFYGADGSVSHNRYHTGLVDDTTYDEAVFVDRSNRDQLLAHVPPPGAISEAERQQIIADLEATHDITETAKKAPHTPVSKEELEHVLQLVAEATPTVVSFYDMLHAAENRANSSDCAVSVAASEYAGQALTDHVDAFLTSFGLPSGPSDDGEPRFQQKVMTDGSGLNMMVKCGYTGRREDRPAQPVGYVNLKEPLNQAQLHDQLPEEVARTATLYPAGGRIEKTVVLSVMQGKLRGTITERIYGTSTSEPLTTRSRPFIPDDTHTQLFSKITQNPQIYNQPIGK